MATFPALVPSSRQYVFGDYPVSVDSTISGNSIRFLHGANQFAYSLNLIFNSITQPKADLIRDHYRSQNGSHIPFELPSEVWQGYSSASAVVPAATLWRYSTTVQETHRPAGTFDLTVSLVSIV
jgi:hypothetical protein